MSTIITRTGKGSPLTTAEMDANLNNLNNTKQETSAKGAANGYAALDGTSKVPIAQLPKQSSLDSTVADKLLTPGSFGLGASLATAITDYNLIVTPGTWSMGATVATNGPANFVTTRAVVLFGGDTTYGFQIAFDANDPTNLQMAFRTIRSTVWQAWGETFHTRNVSAFVQTIFDDVDATAVRATISAQASDATLTAMAGVVTAADKIIYFNGVDTATSATLTAFARTLLDDVDAVAARLTLGLNNVDNTSDVNKPVSTAQQTALNLKANADNAALTGVPVAPTAVVGTNTTQIASTAFVKAEILADTSHEPAITADVVTKFWSGTKTWRDLATDVRAAVLTGFSTATGTVVTATDSILVAVGKLQAQVTANVARSTHTGTQLASTISNFAATTLATVLTGFSTASSAVVTATDTVLGAIGKLQAQVSLKANSDSPTFTGVPVVPTALAGTNTTQAASTEFVITEVAGAIVADNTKEPAITAQGTTATFWSGTKTFRDLATDVRAIVLTGLSTATSTVVAATDSVLVAIGKLQAQVTLRAPLASPPLTGTPTTPTAAVGTNTTQIASTAFVAANAVLKDSDTGAAIVPRGTVAQRGTAAIGKIRFNTDTGEFEGCKNGTTWVGLQPAGAGSGDVLGVASSVTDELVLFADAGGKQLKRGPVVQNGAYSSKQANTSDATAGVLLTPGAFGVGAGNIAAPFVTSDDCNLCFIGGDYFVTGTTLNTPITAVNKSTLIVHPVDSSVWFQEYIDFTTGRKFFRKTTGAWTEIFTSTNVSTFIKTLFDDADAATARTTLGLGAASTSALASVAPLVNGTAAVGVSTAVARQDHVHPSDTTKFNTAGGTITGATTISNATSSTSSTTGALQVVGGVGVGGAIFAAGNISGNSDIRLKTNIITIDDALNKVCQLNGVIYDRTDIELRQTGLIAQDVQKVIPEAVSGEDILSVAYGNLVGLLVEAIKELKAEVDELKSKV